MDQDELERILDKPEFTNRKTVSVSTIRADIHAIVLELCSKRGDSSDEAYATALKYTSNTTYLKWIQFGIDNEYIFDETYFSVLKRLVECGSNGFHLQVSLKPFELYPSTR
jgi:hypothetical protein